MGRCRQLEGVVVQILAGVHSGASYTYHVFTSSGTLTVTSGGTMSLLAVGGGGAGGASRGGGGGGAELDDGSWTTGVSVTANQTITIGAGGTPVADAPGNQGGTTTIGSLVSSLGGGGGGGDPGGTGGSGGGGQGNFNTVGGTASGTRTFAGGAGNRDDGGNGPYASGGGGGGASAVGTAGGVSGGVTGGNGGQGVAITTIDANLTATNFPTTLTSKGTFSSGGAGGAWSIDGTGTKTQGIGGTGAGNGGLSSGNPTRTSINVPTAATMYGAGGGGGGQATADVQGLAGFAGIVIVRYITGTAVASGGQETITGLPIL